MRFNLLTNGDSNTKLAKSNKQSRYLTFGLSLAPYKESGYQTCSSASKGCAAACIFTSGLGGVFRNINEARIRKTKLFFEDRDEFKRQLIDDIARAKRAAGRRRKKLAVRLNMFSDLQWERLMPELFELFPDVQFYDYTKHVVRMGDYCDGFLPANYHLTFSRSESNQRKAIEVLMAGGNVSVVFSSKELPETWNGFEVLNGDSTDLRFLEGMQGAVIGLYAKGEGRKDQTGFVVQVDAV